VVTPPGSSELPPSGAKRHLAASNTDNATRLAVTQRMSRTARAPARARAAALKREAAPRGAPPGALWPPEFSLRYLDRSVSPRDDFYRFAVGSWIKRNPVPADKSRWGAFEELVEYNYRRLHRLVEQTRHHQGAQLRTVAREVGDFYASATDSERRDRLRFAPVRGDVQRIDSIQSKDDFVRVLADFHGKGIPALFSTQVYPDKKNSRVYAFYLQQGGLSLPDREYYLAPIFRRQRKAFEEHLVRSLSLLGESNPEARRAARLVLELETELAKASRTRTDLRDEQKNYNKTTIRKLQSLAPSVPWDHYLSGRGARKLSYVIVGQPEFLAAVGRLLRQRPVSDWRTYLRWHLLRSSAPYLHRAAEAEYFRFFHRTLLGQLHPEPKWKRAVRAADRVIGDALGQLFVAEYFPPQAAARMKRLVADLREVFRDRLQKLDWMTPATRRRALAKFRRFTTKIGHPRHFRDDSRLRIDRGDYLGNIRRAIDFESRRKIARLGRRVDPDEWRMTAPMVNAYFDPTQNEIVFPAGILQPPFFDSGMDDAVNYGGIGLVIGHEITHGYDDQGRRYDERGNLRDWWTEKDAQEFQRRAKKIIAEYDGFEALPGAHVKGALTVGENIADLGGVSIAFEALQRRLARDPGRRRLIEGLTPEQRFFLSYAQIWRETVRTQDARRLLTVDEHAPGRFRVVGAVVNSPPFFEAFGVQKGDPMFRPPRLRVQIW
jgi:putative endopeptidase